MSAPPSEAPASPALPAGWSEPLHCRGLGVHELHRDRAPSSQTFSRERGSALDRAVRATAAALEDAWGREVGEAAWNHFRSVLERIVARRYPPASIS